MKTEAVLDYLKHYDGRPLRLMEVCGTHTAAIFKHGIRDLISPRIELIAGPGCPVCVTPTSYIDRCIAYAKKPDHLLLTFGDMMKVPGSSENLSQAKGDGAEVEWFYSPLEAVERARANPSIEHIVAAVGFETTAPAFALAIEEAAAAALTNIRFLTALKTTLPALTWICDHEQGIDGFLCPGHVSVITGSEVYRPLADRYHRPFVVTGFEAEHLLAAIYTLVKQLSEEKATLTNLYKNAVQADGNQKAQAMIDKYFIAGPAHWRGLGMIPGSGLYLRENYRAFEAGSHDLGGDDRLPTSCRCSEVIVGRITPPKCPLFGKGCTPSSPYGPCMVSSEGACGIWYRNRQRGDQ